MAFDITHITSKQFDRELGIMLAWIRANEGRKMVTVPGHGDVRPSSHAKELCDLDLAREIGSYHFVTTRAGRRIFHGLVLTAEARRKAMAESRTYYEARKATGADATPVPYELAETEFNNRGWLHNNPFPSGYERLAWEDAFLDAYERVVYSDIVDPIRLMRIT